MAGTRGGRSTDRQSPILDARSLHVVVITDPTPPGRRAVMEVVEAALQGGCRCIQLRNKSATPVQLLEEAHRLRALTREYGALLIVNDRFDVALASRADGVHVGPHDIPVEAIRASVPDGFIIGASCDDLGTARELVASGADYLGCGTVFATSTKLDAGAAIGPSRVAELASATSVPVVAIGGISVDNAHELSATGAAGIAVVGAVMGARDPRQAVEHLRAAFSSGG